jgi:hypothetical protein
MIRITMKGEVGKRLREMREAFEERRALLSDLGEVIVDHARWAILSSKDADTGGAFASLAESTLKRGFRISSKPLLRTGALFGSIKATQPRGNQVSVRHLWYGIFANEGSGRMRRRFLGKKSLAADLYRFVRVFARKSMNGQTYRIGDGG